MEILVAIYALFMVGYMLIKAFGVGNPYRGWVKAVLSSTFLGVGLHFTAINGWHLDSLLVAIALFLAWIGDALLVFKHKSNMFHAGCVSFGFANLFLIAHSLIVYQWEWWSLILFAAFMAASLLCQKFGVFSFGRSALYLNFYSITVGYNGLHGLALAIVLGTTPALLFGIGSMLFLTSDVVLGLFMFKFKKWPMDVLNTLLYFSGMMLIAFSIA